MARSAHTVVIVLASVMPIFAFSGGRESDCKGIGKDAESALQMHQLCLGLHRHPVLTDRGSL